MDYSKLGCLEINSIVHKHYCSDMNRSESEYGSDYCQEWAYAGDIIEEYGISVINKGHLWEAYGAKRTSLGALTGLYAAVDEIPMRAAMICFLQMKDAEKES